MNLIKRVIGISLAAAIALVLAGGTTGCNQKQKADDPTQPRDTGFGPSAYQEVPYQGSIYVVSSESTAQKVREGKMPTTLPFIRGEQGRKVFFETGEPGLTGRLQGEYLRRHPR